MKTLVQILLAVMVFCSGANAATILVLPSAQTSSVGGSISVNVNVAGLTDLYAFQFDVIFDPAVLSAFSVTEGSLFSSVGVFFSPGIIDNTAGTISFIGDSLSGPGSGINTNGTLAQIIFRGLSPGSSSIVPSNVILLDSNLNDLAASAVPGSVNVTGVPEPGYLTFLGVPLVAYLAWSRRLKLTSLSA